MSFGERCGFFLSFLLKIFINSLYFLLPLPTIIIKQIIKGIEMNNVVSKNIVEHYNWGDNCDGWHLLKSDELSVIQELVPPGRSEVKHYHEKSKQFFFVLAGTATIIAGSETNVINSREGIFIPAGIAHQLRNDSKNNLEFLVISSPKSHGDKFEVK